MGVELAVIYDSEMLGERRFTTNPDGRNVAAASPRLDEIAESMRLPPFSRFIPDDNIEAFLAGDPDLRHLMQGESDLDGADLNDEPDRKARGEHLPELWFTAAEGLALLVVLIKALRSEPAWSKGQLKGWATEVTDSLERLRFDLEVADKAGARFCLHYT